MLTSRWDDIVASAGSLDGIVVEITEQDVIDDYDTIRTKIQAIRSLRGNVAIDDAGSGYASLKHVMELKPNFVKLDRFFVGNCNAERSKSTLIQMIGTASGRLDAWVVAEGVETAAELDELLRLNVPLAQGFYLGYPEPAMRPLAPDVCAALQSRVQAFTLSGTLLIHTDLCSPFPTRAEAASFLEGQSEVELAVVLDQWQRPLELLETHPLVGVRSIENPMRVLIFTDPAEVLYRALTRPSAQHFDPLAIIDEQGKFHGAIRIDRLMRAVLDAKSS